MKKEKDKKPLMERLVDYKINTTSQIRSNMEYNYRSLNAKRELIVRALVFWKFILDAKSFESMRERSEFLAKFIADKNIYIQVVAMIESLPTSVWRKILWKHNIDFMSFESFLRRISQKQIENIRENYQDLYVKVSVPRAFSQLDCFTKNITVFALLCEEIVPEVRYASKGSWSHNLLRLDFGFNAYVNGVTDDNKVVEFSPLRFLSVKNHADDFVVNQEDGKYWWLYRKARSNYAWMWDKTVQLKTHICPGFWYTLLVHLLFWVVSPATFIGLISIFAAKGFSETSWLYIIPMGIPSVVTPLWLLAAGLRFLFRHVLTEERRESIEETAKSVKRWFKKHENVTILPAAILMLTFFALTVIGTVSLILMRIYYWLYPTFGVGGIVTLGLTLIIYVGYKIYYKYQHHRLPKFKEYPRYWRIPILLVVTWLGAKGLIMYHEQLWIAFMWVVGYVELIWSFIIKVIIDLLGMFWNFILAMGFMLPWIAIPLVLMGIILLMDKLINEEKREKILNSVFCYMDEVLTIVSVLFAIAMLPIIFSPGFYISIEMMIALAFSGIFFVGAYYMAYKYNPGSRRIDVVAARINTYLSKDNEVSSWYLFKNAWIKTLDGKDIDEVVLRVRRILRDAVDYDSWDAYPVVFPYMTRESIDKLDQYKKQLGELRRKVALRAIKYIVKGGRDAGKAIALATSRIDIEEKIGIITITALKVIFCWALLAWRILKQIGKFLSLIWEWIVTIPRLYKMFNERCPFVTRVRVLSIK